MSSTNAPFGLRAVYSPSGIIREMQGTILSTYAADLYTGQPVKMGTDGTLQAAGTSGTYIGLFAGCQYLPSGAQRPVISPSWPSGTTATEIIAYYTMDPYLVYEIQADGPVSQTNIGNQYNFSAVTSSNGLGYSIATLGTGSVTTSGNAQMRVIGIANGIDNAAGDAFTVVQVQISQHQYVATLAAF
jgi:hypothetical protein